MVCKISQPKKGPCENGPWLRNNFASPKYLLRNRPLAAKSSYSPLRKFSQLRNTPLAHECHFADPPSHFAAAKCFTKSSTPKNSNFRSRTLISQVVSQLRNHPLAHECHFAALHPHFATTKWAVKIPIRCEIRPLLRNRPSAAKIKIVPWHPF